MGNPMNGIILTVNLQGILSSNIVKEEVITHRHGESLLSKKITYRCKQESKCVSKTNISEEVVSGWIGGKAPFFIRDFLWHNMSKPQRLKAWVERFDEGFGVSFQEL